MMLGRERATAPADLVIWISTSGLALLAGAGTAFALWRLLHNSPATGIAGGAVAALALGLALIGLSQSRPTMRVFLVVMGLVLAVAFFAGHGAFAAFSG